MLQTALEILKLEKSLKELSQSVIQITPIIKLDVPEKQSFVVEKSYILEEFPKHQEKELTLKTKRISSKEEIESTKTTKQEVEQLSEGQKQPHHSLKKKLSLETISSANSLEKSKPDEEKIFSKKHKVTTSEIEEKEPPKQIGLAQKVKPFKEPEKKTIPFFAQAKPKTKAMDTKKEETSTKVETSLTSQKKITHPGYFSLKPGKQIAKATKPTHIKFDEEGNKIEKNTP